MINYHKAFCAVALLTIAGCSQLQTANGVAKASVTAIASACQYAPVALALAGSLAKGGASHTVANAGSLISAGCTVAGQAALAANDAAPVSATNSGNSAAWLLTTAADALAAATAAPVAKPAS